MPFCSPHSVNAAHCMWNIHPQGMQQSVITLVLRCRRHLGPELSDLQLSQSGWLPTNTVKLFASQSASNNRNLSIFPV